MTSDPDAWQPPSADRGGGRRVPAWATALAVGVVGTGAVTGIASYAADHARAGTLAVSTTSSATTSGTSSSSSSSGGLTAAASTPTTVASSTQANATSGGS
jgi:hypothetical protein